ncbi:MAG: asparagine synthetase B, partial [Deltaproteobacteria bacterium]
MCGIAGLWGEGDIERMLSVLIHRGPDDAGIYREGSLQLGSRRLAVIDLETGHQPIHNEDETIWVVFNGAIFNY